MFSTISQTACITGLIVYSFWLVSVFFFFLQDFSTMYKVINKNVQTITLLFSTL